MECIIIKGERYYYYDTYDEYRKAYRIARWYKKKNKSKYYILIIEGGGIWSPQIFYKLYLTKAARIL